MTEHWNPISNWSKHRYEDRLESVNDDIDGASGSKLSGDTNVQHQDIEQLSYSNDNQELSQPQREPVEVHPGDFGGYGLDLVQDSDLKNGSEDMVTRVPPTCYDTSKLKSSAPPTYQEKPSLTHDKHIDFFGDSHVAGRNSRSTLDQDSLHRGSISTLPSAGQRRGSTSSTQRRSSASLGQDHESFLSNQKHESSQKHRTSTKTKTHDESHDESGERKSSLVDLAVDAVTSVGAGAAAAASSVSDALIGHTKPSPTEEESKEMPSTWTDGKHPSDNTADNHLNQKRRISNTSNDHSIQKERRASHASETHSIQSQRRASHTSESLITQDQKRASQSYGGLLNDNHDLRSSGDNKRSSLDYGHSTSIDYGHNKNQQSSIEPAIHGQQACPYTQDIVKDDMTVGNKGDLCQRVHEPTINGQNPSYYGHEGKTARHHESNLHDETTDHHQSNIIKARRWSEGWSRESSSLSDQRGRQDASSASQFEKAKLDSHRASQSRLESANLTQSRLENHHASHTSTSQSSSSHSNVTSRRRSSDILGLTSSYKTGQLAVENITSSSLHAAQFGTARERSNDNSDKLLEHRLSTSSLSNTEDHSLSRSSQSSATSYANAVRRESRLHEDFDQTMDHAPGNKVKSFKGVLAAGGGGIVTSGKTDSQALPQSGPAIDELEDEEYTDSDLPPAWGDQPLPIPPRNPSDVANGRDRSSSNRTTNATTSKASSTLKSAVNATTKAASQATNKAITSTSTHSAPAATHQTSHASEDFDEYDGIRVRGYNDHLNFDNPSHSETKVAQDHGYSRDHKSKGVFATASAAALGALGGLGFGHRNSTSYLENEDEKYYDSHESSSDSTSTSDKQDDHVAPKGWLSNADGATPPPQKWSEIHQDVKSKGWSKDDQTLPTGTGHGDRNKGSKSKTLDEEKSALDYDTPDNEVEEKSSKGIMAGVGAAVSGILGLGHKDTETHDKRDTVSSHSQHDKTTSQAINGPDQENHKIQPIGGGRYEVNEADRFEGDENEHDLNESIRESHHESNLESGETQNKSRRSSLLGAAAAVGSALGLDYKNQRSSRDHSSEYGTTEDHSASGLDKTKSQTERNISTASQNLTSNAQNGHSSRFGSDHNKYGSDSDYHHQTKSSKGVLAGAAASVGGVLGLSHDTNQSETDVSEDTLSESHNTGIPSERTKSVPSLPRDNVKTENHKQKQKVTTAPQTLSADVQENSNETTARHHDQSSSSGKGKIAGAAAAVGSALGLSHGTDKSETEREDSADYVGIHIPSERKKSVPDLPSHDTSSVGQKDKSKSKVSYGYDMANDEHSEENHHSKSNKGIIAGAAGAAATSVGSMLGLSHNNETSETETWSSSSSDQYEDTEISSDRTKDVPGIPSKRGIFRSNKAKYGISADRRKSVPGVKQYDQDDTSNQSNAHVKESRRSSVESSDSSVNTSREDDTGRSKSGKGIIGGAVASVGSMLGSNNKNSESHNHNTQSTENDENDLSANRNKSVPGIPSNSESRESRSSANRHYESSHNESGHKKLDNAIQDNGRHSTSNKHDSHSKSAKGVIAGASAAVGNALGLDNKTSKVDSNQQGTHSVQDQKYGLPAERTKSVPDIPSNTKSQDESHYSSLNNNYDASHQSTRESNRYESRHNELDNRYEYGQDNRYKFSQDNNSNRHDYESNRAHNKSGKGIIPGTTATVSSVLGMDHKAHQTESHQDHSTDSYNDSTQHFSHNENVDNDQDVTTAPQTLAGNIQSGLSSDNDDISNRDEHHHNSESSRYSSTTDNNNHESQTNPIKHAVAGAASGVAGALGMNHRKSTDSGRAYEGTYDYKKLPMTNEHDTSIERDYYGIDHTTGADVRGSRHNSKHTLGADVRGSRHNNDHTSGSDVRGSRYNSEHVVDADVRGSRYNSIQDNNLGRNSYDSNSYDSHDKGVNSNVFKSSQVSNQATSGRTDRKQSAPGVPSKEYLEKHYGASNNESLHQSNQDSHKTRYVSFQGTGQDVNNSHIIGSSGLNQSQIGQVHNQSSGYGNGSITSDRTKAVPAAPPGYGSKSQSDHYENYNHDSSNAERRRSSSKSAKDVIGGSVAAVGGMLGLNHSDKNDQSPVHVSDRQYESAYQHNVDPNQPKKGVVSEKVGAAGAAAAATAATVGGALGIKNKDNKPEDASEVLRHQGDTADQLDGFIPDQNNFYQDEQDYSSQGHQDNYIQSGQYQSNQVEKDSSTTQTNKSAISTKDHRRFKPVLTIEDKPDQGFTTSKRHREINSKQDQGFTTSQRDESIKSKQYQQRVKSERHPKISNVHRKSALSDNGDKAAGVAALGGIHGSTMYDQSTSDRSQHTTKSNAQRDYYTQKAHVGTQDNTLVQKTPTGKLNKSYSEVARTGVDDNAYSERDISTRDNSHHQNYVRNNTSTQDYAQSNAHALNDTKGDIHTQDYSQTNSKTQNQDYSQSNAHRNSYADRNVESFARRNTGTMERNYGLLDDKDHATDHNTGGAGPIATTVAAAAATVGGALGLNKLDSKKDTHHTQASHDSNSTVKKANDNISSTAHNSHISDGVHGDRSNNAQTNYGYDNMMSHTQMDDSVQRNYRDHTYGQNDIDHVTRNSSTQQDQGIATTGTGQNSDVTTAPQILAAENQYGKSSQVGQDPSNRDISGATASHDQRDSGVTTAPQTLAADNQYGRSTQGETGNDSYDLSEDVYGNSPRDNTVNDSQFHTRETNNHDKGIISGATGAVGAAAATVGGALGLNSKNDVEKNGVGTHDSSVKYQDHASQRNHSFPAKHTQEIRNDAQALAADSQTTTKPNRTIPGSFTNGVSKSGNRVATGTAVAGGATGAAIGSKLGSHQTTENWAENNSSTIHRGQTIPVTKNDDLTTPPQSLANGTKDQISPVAPQRRDQVLPGQNRGQYGVSTQNGIATSNGLGHAGVANATGASALGSRNDTSESISSTRATTGKIIPDSRQPEIKERQYDNFKNTPNSIDNLNNPKHRNNSITQGFRSKFSSAVRRLSGQSGGTSTERRLSDAEMYKNQQQSVDYQQSAFGNNHQTAFGGGSAFGNAPAPVYQERRQSGSSIQNQETRPSVQDNHHPLNRTEPNAGSRLEHVHTETSPIHESHQAQHQSGTVHRIDTSDCPRHYNIHQDEPTTVSHTDRRASRTGADSTTRAAATAATAASTVPRNENGTVYRNDPMETHIHKAQHIEPTNLRQESNTLRDGQPLQHIKHTNAGVQENVQNTNTLRDGQPLQHFKHSNTGVQENVQNTNSLRDGQPLQHVKHTNTGVQENVQNTNTLRDGQPLQHVKHTNTGVQENVQNTNSLRDGQPLQHIKHTNTGVQENVQNTNALRDGQPLQHVKHTNTGVQNTNSLRDGQPLQHIKHSNTGVQENVQNTNSLRDGQPLQHVKHTNTGVQENVQNSNSLRDGQPLQHIKHTNTGVQENAQNTNTLRDGQPLQHFKGSTAGTQENAQSSSLHDGQPLGHSNGNDTGNSSNAGVKQNYARIPGVYSLKPAGSVDVDENGEINLIKLNEGTKAINNVVKAEGVSVQDAAKISAYHANQ